MRWVQQGAGRAAISGCRLLQARVRLAGCCVPAARHLHVSAPPHSQHVEPARKEWKSPHDWSELVQNYGKRRDVFDEPVEIHKLTVTCRSLKEQGSRYSQKIRAAGRLPGVLYGPGLDGDKSRLLVTVNRLDVEREMRRLDDSILTTVFDLEVEGHPKGEPYVQRVILRDLDLDPGSARPIAVNFMRYRPGYPLELPVCFINEELCEPIKRGGMLVSINRRVRVKCDGETIPEMLTVDLTDLRAGTVIKLDRVKFPKGVVPHEVPPHFCLAVVKGKKADEPEPGEEEEEKN